MPTINNSTKKALSSLYDKATFSIPRYQRAYSWEESNWRELWDDIKNSILEKDNEHFLGSIVYYHGSTHNSKYSQYEIIDGQQRLTTITILMRVLYEKLRQQNDKVYLRFSEELYDKYIGSRENENFFLNLSKKDQSYFRDYIQRKDPIRKLSGKLISNKNIRKCFDFFTNQINEITKGVDAEEFCWNLKKKLETNLVFVVIDVDTDVDAYMIFESLNSKRQELTVSDLLKNYIFSAADQYEKEKPDSRKLHITEDNWDRMEQNLDKIETNQYIRHFWISKYGKVFEKELYRKIKDELNHDSRNILAFFEGVVEESEVYASIVNANTLNLSSDGAKALNQLRKLRNKQYYPLILSAISGKWEYSEISELIKQIAAVAIRRAIICSNPNELETLFADSAPKIREKKISLQDIIDELSGKYWVSDSKIIEEIKTIDFEDQEYLAKFILREYENSQNDSDEKILGKLSLEHVLPRTPDNVNNWGIPEKRQKELLWNIGNLALIGQKYNSKMSNKAFSKKKVWLKKTNIKTTVVLADLNNWTEDEILKRNDKIGNFIIKWWQKVN